jgi:hypothetical protein
MIRSLRKGRTSVYVQHANTGHNLGAEKYECEVSAGKLILRLSIRPVDQNQRFDENYLHDEELVSVVVDDSTVIDGLQEFVSSYRHQFETYELQLMSRGKTLCFAVNTQRKIQGTHETLTLNVVGTS